MKDNIKIALLAIIAAGVVFMAIGQRNAPNGIQTFAPVAAKPAAPAIPPPSKSTFDPLTPPVQAEPAPYDGPTTTIGYKVDKHDFGKVMQDSENAYTFKFTNTGKEPLVITNAVGSCGCTVPDYPKHPIAPGASSEINVVYKPGKQEGQQMKTITITANTVPSQTVLNISADVQVVK
ncbi:MAG: DUF1573 domain-containing protein [Flavobacteriales bacterium]|jgi:hypothetical protein|nr:DUF1573 domain-containing protein [Flavobacteriales bacterium]